jgi:peptide/nickel transport system permease protein
MATLTPSQRTWKAFKRNKLAMAGLVFIALAFLIAVLGYLVMPDDTPLANNQTIQISLKKPATTYMMLRLNKPEKIDTIGLLNKMLYGQPSFFRDIPITGYKFDNNTVTVSEYIGDEDKPEQKTYQLSSNSSARIIHKTFVLGTDAYGRDMLSRLILGTRISLSVGIMAVIISLLIGVTVGAVAGYFGGWIDACLSWLMNILWALPALLLVIAISFALGKGLWQVFVAVGLSMWVEVARLVRGQVISLKQTEYVEAAHALGYSNARIIGKHILPNIAGPILVMAASNFASAILLEAGLSFLGFGAQPPMPTWGSMIKEHYGYIIMDSAYLSVIPGLAIMLIVYAFNLVTVGLRDAFDIRSQSARILN